LNRISRAYQQRAAGWNPGLLPRTGNVVARERPEVRAILEERYDDRLRVEILREL